MGLLVLGEPLSWQQTAQLRHYVKYHGIIQFILAYNRHKNRKCDRFLWGDEIECLLLYMDKSNYNIRAQLRANQILDELHKEQALLAEQNPGSELNITFHPEYANNMLEVTPFIPYGGSICDLLAVETNMRFRRAVLQSKLRPGEFVMYTCNFPLFGTENFTHVPPDNKILPNTPISTSTNSTAFNVFALPPRPDSAASPNTSHHLDGIDTVGELPQTMIPLAPSPLLPQLGQILKSNFVPDNVMSPHPRFATLSGNIRRRRGKKVDIALPLYQDEKTILSDDGNIHSDAMGFGMGSCCLQVTFQTHSNTEARFLYDQMAILSPIFLSLTANCPFHRGHIVDTDVRWSTICQSVDDRTDAEKGIGIDGENNSFISPTPIISPQKDADIPELQEENPYLVHFRNKNDNSKKDNSKNDSNVEKRLTVNEWAANGIGIPYNDLPFSLHDSNIPNQVTIPRLYKSRYSSVDCYINHDPRFGYHPKFNDVTFPYHEPSYELLIENGVDQLMSKHIASLWMRDPLVMFHGQISQDDTTQTNHFESIQSTNWRSVRYKPPSHAENPGFRVEFRTMELSFTDFENAAFTVFLALLARAIVHFELNLYIPLSKVDENFIYAHRNHSIKNDKFWFKTGVNMDPKSTQTTPSATNPTTPQSAIKLISRGHCTPCCDAQADGIPIESFTLDKALKIPSDDIIVDVSDDSNEDDINTNDCAATPAPAGAFTKQSTPFSISSCTLETVDDNYHDSSRLMTIDEIINGTSDFIGFIPIVEKYLAIIDCDEQSRFIINQYLSLIKNRANLTLMTGAQFQRQFIQNHPSYKHDSIIPHDALRDLMMVIHGISNQTCHIPELLGGLDPSLGFVKLSDEIINGNCCGCTKKDTKLDDNIVLENDLFNIPIVNLPMDDLLEQLRTLPCTDPSPYADKSNCKDCDKENITPLRSIIRANTDIILSSPQQQSSQDNKLEEEKNQKLTSSIDELSTTIVIQSNQDNEVNVDVEPSTPVILTQPQLNPRSNYAKLINNTFTRRLNHAFTAAQGEEQLQLPSNLKGSRRALIDMQSLHGHAPSATSTPAAAANGSSSVAVVVVDGVTIIENNLPTIVINDSNNSIDE